MSQSAEPLPPMRGLRKEPQQARSRARVRAIMAAAEAIVASEGVEALTMRRLAEEAAVPVGTVYQFFDDKTAVVDAVAYQHLDTLGPVIEELTAGAARGVPWPELFDVVFDRMVERTRGNPAYVAIWVGRHLSPELQRVDDANIDATAAILCSVLSAQENLPATPELVSACRVAIQTADALLQLAFRLDRAGDPATLDQARRIEHLYLADIAADPRYRAH